MARSSSEDFDRWAFAIDPRRHARHGKTDIAASAFYVLWVNAGEDREAALKSAREQSRIPPGVPAYCAEWKVPEEYIRQGRILGPRARSRLTNHQRLSDDEEKILWHALGDDCEIHTIAAGAEKPDERTSAATMTGRQTSV